MRENQPEPEILWKLPKAVNAVSELYLANDPTKQKDNLWKQVAQDFPHFSENIKKLGEVIKEADKKRKNFPELSKHMQLFFGYVKEDTARSFLNDIWCFRINPYGNLMDTGFQAAREITGEIGIEGRLCGGPLKDITLKVALSSVLQGKLKLTPQKQRANH